MLLLEKKLTGISSGKVNSSISGINQTRASFSSRVCLVRANGWEHRQEPKRIDFIFKHVRSSLQINEMRLIFNEYFYPIVSDHFGCFACFHLG